MVKKMAEIKEKFYNMVQPKAEPDPLKPDFEFITPSPQFWNELTGKEQNELRQIVADEGKDIEGYLRQMRQMLPKDPRGKR